MKAFIYEKYGSPDVLELKEIAKPSPRDNEVLVKIRAVAINEWDYGLLTGTPFVNRMINGLRKPKKQIIGSDIAGTVEAVGKSVTLFQPGDEVYGDLSNYWGGFAEFVCAAETSLSKKPAKMSFVEAAAIPQAGLLAVQGLIDIGQMKKGQKILINGAGGGVGTFGIQLAKQYDTEVTAVDNSAKLAKLTSLGFDHVIDYQKTDFTRNGQPYDLILDAKTNRSVFRYLNSLTPNGTYASVGGDSGKLMAIFVLSPFLKLIYKKTFRLVVLKFNKDLEFMNDQFNAGKIRPVIDRVYPFNETREAMRHYEKGEFCGKIVIKMEHE